MAVADIFPKSVRGISSNSEAGFCVSRKPVYEQSVWANSRHDGEVTLQAGRSLATILNDSGSDGTRLVRELSLDCEYGVARDFQVRCQRVRSSARQDAERCLVLT